MPSFRQLCNLDKIYDGMILRHIHSTELPTLIGGSWAICEKNICLVMSDNIIKLLNIGGGGDCSHVFSLQNLTLTKGRFCDCQWKSSTFCGLCETKSLASSVTLTCDHIDLKPIIPGNDPMKNILQAFDMRGPTNLIELKSDVEAVG